MKNEGLQVKLSRQLSTADRQLNKQVARHILNQKKIQDFFKCPPCKCERFQSYLYSL